MFRSLASSSFVRNFARLASGTVLAQLLMVLSSPLITRLYTEEAFGLYATYAALVAILGVIAALRYNVAIPLSGSLPESRALVKLCMLAALGVGSICLFMFTLFSEPILLLAELASARSLLVLSAFGIFATGVLNTMSYLCLSGGQYSVLSRSRIVHAVVHVTVQLSASAFGAMALACGQLAGKTMAILSMLPAARKLLAPRGDAVLEETVVTVREVAVAYKRFPLYSSWAGLFNSLGENLPFLLLAVLFSPAAAGLFALTHRVLSLPITVVSSLIGEIFYSNAGSKLKNGTLSASFADTYRVLSFLITMPSLVIIIIGPDFFAFVFGEPWRESGVFAQFMALMIYSNFVSAPLCSIMSVYGRDREFLAFNVILIVCRLAGIAYGYQQQDLHLAIGVYCSISALCYLGLLLRLIYMSGNDLSTFVQNTLVPLALNTLLVIPLFFVTQRSYFDTSWWLVFCATGVFGFLYLFITARAQLARALASTSAS